MAGMAFTCASLGLIHSLAHKIGGEFGITHGLANAILLPYIVQFNSKATDKVAWIEKELGVKNFPEAIKELNKKLNIPLNLKDVDEVEIGANCTIDRGVTDTTIIGEGTKMDNQIQIGHDTIIGKRCLIASQVGIAGCCNIGNDVTIWGQVGVSSDITVEDEVVILATSGVSKDLKKGKTYFGAPAEEAKEYYKKQVKITRLIQG